MDQTYKYSINTSKNMIIIITIRKWTLKFLFHWVLNQISLWNVFNPKQYLGNSPQKFKNK